MTQSIFAPGQDILSRVVNQALYGVQPSPIELNGGIWDKMRQMSKPPQITPNTGAYGEPLNFMDRYKMALTGQTPGQVPDIQQRNEFDFTEMMRTQQQPQQNLASPPAALQTEMPRGMLAPTADAMEASATGPVQMWDRFRNSETVNNGLSAASNWLNNSPAGSDLRLMGRTWDPRQLPELYSKYVGEPFSRYVGGRPPTPPGGTPPETGPGTPPVALPEPSAPPVPPGGTPAPTPPASAPEAFLRGMNTIPMPQVGVPRQGSLSLPQPPQATMPNVAYPDTPVPQQQRPAAFDRSKTDEWLDKAAPKPYESDPRDMIIAGLLGAAGGLGNGQRGDNLGQTFSRMVGGAAPQIMAARQQDKQLERESARETRQYAGARANTEIGLENARTSREDAGNAVDYSNAQALRQDMLDKTKFNLEVSRLQNSIEQGNYALVSDRLSKLHSAGVQDRQLDILQQRAQAAMVSAGLRGQQGSQGALNQTGSSLVQSSLIQPYVDATRARLRTDKKLQAMELTNPREFNDMVTQQAMAEAFRSASPQEKQSILRLFQAQRGQGGYNPADGLEF